MSFTDEKYNILFVKCVQQYPCLYDVSCKDYSRRDKTDEAWMNVARKMGDTESNCRERWKNIRTVFCRHIKDKKVGSKRTYYLYDVLQFLVPYIKTKKPKTSIVRPEMVSVDSILNESNDNNDIEDENTISLYRVEDPSHPEGNGNAQVDCDSNSRNDDSLIGNPMLSNPLELDMGNNLETNEHHHQNTHSRIERSDLLVQGGYADERYNPDRSFLMGLLPEIGSLNADKKRNFKMKLTQLLCDLYEEQSKECALPHMVEENAKVSTTPLMEPDTFTKCYARSRPPMSETDEIDDEYKFVSSLLDDSDLALPGLPTPSESEVNTYDEKSNGKRPLDAAGFCEPEILLKTKRTCDSSSSCIASFMERFREKEERKETEFDIFGRSIAVQLNNMSEVKALKLQLKIQTLITQDRLEELQKRELSD